jgi:glucose-6-phosphate isomerase
MQIVYQAAQLPTNQIQEIASTLNPYLGELKAIEKGSYETPESFINLPKNETTLKAVMALKEKLVTPNLKYIINIGIGGSYLGTKAIYDAFHGFFDVTEPSRFPKMLFIDTIDTDVLHKTKTLLNALDPSEVLIVTVSKSGTTLESLINLEILTEDLTKYMDRLVVITKEHSPLWEETCKHNFPCLGIPEKISGRYSVLSAVGLVPLALAGLNVVDLLIGAAKADLESAVLSASLLYIAYQSGLTIHPTFLFQVELESLGKWYRQLAAESLGKEGKGVTPTVAIGSTDLHSMVQLYLGGPRDKFFTFVSTQKENYEVKIPPKNETTEKNMKIILASIEKTFQEKQLPYTKIELPNLSLETLGQFMQFKMLETVFLAKLMNVNAFNQPNVEDYKSKVRVALKN